MIRIVNRQLLLMKVSLQTKFLIVCILLVLLTTASISGTYYVLTKQDKHRESRQRIQIAFDIILDDFVDRLTSYRSWIDEFLAKDDALRTTTSLYHQDESRIGSISFISTNLTKVGDELKRIGHIISAERLTLYAADKRLLTVFQQDGEQETVGIYVTLQAEQNIYIPVDDPSQLTPMLLGRLAIPETPLPAGVSIFYEEDIPEAISTKLFTEGKNLGIEITAPIYDSDILTGVLIIDVFYMQRIVEKFASLSKTDINLFVGNLLSAGTLHAQTSLAPEALKQMVLCEDIREQDVEVDVFSIVLNDLDYYQGRCAIESDSSTIAAITVSLSQKSEKQALKKIRTAVLIVSGIALIGAVGLSLILSRKPIRSMQNIMRVIGVVAEGDLRKTTVVITRDEFGILAMRLNQMIERLRAIVEQVQRSGIQVTSSSTELAAMAKQQEVTVTSQVESTNKVLKSIEKISNVAIQLVKTMQRVAVMSQETTGFASNGQVDLSRMEEAMHHMEEASKSISGRLEAINEKAENITTVVTTITKVADQTNLLSLNAAIEAEKAGEYGRGFTVVAREIRRLADQTAVATLDIEQMVQEMQSAVSAGVIEMDKFITEVRHGVEDVGKISMQLTLIIEQVQALSPNFEEVNRAMGHQSEHAQEINDAMMNLSQEMEQTKDSLHETYTVIEYLNEAVRGLQDEVSRFKVTS